MELYYSWVLMVIDILTQTSMKKKNILTPDQRNTLFDILQKRFESNKVRHKGFKWEAVLKRLEAANEKLWSLNEMEKTGGEPDVIGKDKKTGEIIYCDCSAESPIGRRSICYDHEAQESRKTNKPKNNALDMAADMGIEIIDEKQYRELQNLGKFDSKTSSWIVTPSDVRELGGALFADFRYGKVFVYHNGASSYYASRGFRGILKV